MKRQFRWFMAATLLGTAISQGGCSKLAGGGGVAQPKTEDQKTLYALGLMLGKNIGVFNLNKDELAMVQAGMSSAVLKQKAQVELETFGPKIDAMARARQATGMVAEKEKAKAASEAASKEPGAIKTASGMVIRTVKPGTGPMPVATDKVKVHYVGTLLDGTEFDSSVKRKEPATFPLDGVIKCWTEGLQKMKVGEKAKLICPSEIAYGDNGRPPQIPGGATLLFDVELLEIVK